MTTTEPHQPVKRRPLVRGAVITALVLVAGVGIGVSRVSPSSSTPVTPTSPVVQRAERERRAPQATVRPFDLVAAPAAVDLGDRRVTAWVFNGQLPAPEIRVQAGDVIQARVTNRLPAPLTIHWHGIALRNDMDGVPDVTQPAIAPGASFVYEFTAPDPGTYFYHPHTGTQLDRGLYGPLIVEDPAGTRDYDREVTLLLDDWIDGLGESPEEVLSRLRGGRAGMEQTEGDTMPGMDMGAGEATEEAAEPPGAEGPLGDDTGDVRYPLYLINGRSPASPATFDARPGERVRLRIVNAGSDTPFRVAVGGQRLTVTASDGFPVEPQSGDALLIGMGERYDAVVTVAGPGVFPIVAAVEGKAGRALAILRSGPGPQPPADVAVAELAGRLITQGDLRAAPAVALPAAKPDRTYTVALTGDMASYRWALGVPGKAGKPLPVREGERVRLVFDNQTAMWHPIHLHGHTFQVTGPSGAAGVRKDTVVVPARSTVVVDFTADNPGQWALHCHNIYHAEAGMVTVVSYVK